MVRGGRRRFLKFCAVDIRHLSHLTVCLFINFSNKEVQRDANHTERKLKVHPITLELFGLPPWANVEKVAALDNRCLYMNISNQTSSLGGFVWDTISVVLDTFQPTEGSNSYSY